MDTVKVARDYYVSSQSSLLIPNRDYGSRKLLQFSGLPKPLGQLPNLPRPSGIFRSFSSTQLKVKQQKLVHSVSDSSLEDYHQCGQDDSQKGGRAQPKGEDPTDPFPQPIGPDTYIMKSGSKQWIHTPEQLLKGNISYNVKFLGECAVDQPKGTDVVKDAIRKMKFSKHLKRAEGQKPPKVQLIISVDGVGIQDPKSKATLHEYPLHRISYCADDKSDKKMFTFIAKAATSNDHFCYVFNCSDKSAEDITLTVGQAFDLAYKKFLEESSNNTAGAGEDLDYKKQSLLLQRKVNSLQFENDSLKKRIAELEKLKDRSDLEEFMKNNHIPSLSTVMLNLRDPSEAGETDETSDDFEESEPSQQPSAAHHSSVGRRLENLIFDSDVSVTNGKSSSAPQSPAPILSPPPPSTRHHRSLVGSVSSPGQAASFDTAPQPVSHQQQLPGNPFSSPAQSGWTNANADPFGMGAFSPAANTPFTPTTNGLSGAAMGTSSHQELMDIQAGFSRGLSFGTDDFDLDDLDPLNHRL